LLVSGAAVYVCESQQNSMLPPVMPAGTQPLLLLLLLLLVRTGMGMPGMGARRSGGNHCSVEVSIKRSRVVSPIIFDD
jgi:hypothetical protein